jgi:hypothetical protein
MQGDMCVLKWFSLVGALVLVLTGCGMGPKPGAEGAPAPGGGMVAGGPAAIQTGAPRVTAEFRRLKAGAMGPGVERGIYPATTSAEWEQTWQQVFGGGTPARVDFSREVAVVVAMGEQRTAGYAVAVAAAEWDDNVLYLTVEETRPAPGALVAQVITYPYEIVAVQRPAGVAPADVKVVAQWRSGGD